MRQPWLSSLQIQPVSSIDWGQENKHTNFLQTINTQKDVVKNMLYLYEQAWGYACRAFCRQGVWQLVQEPTASSSPFLCPFDATSLLRCHSPLLPIRGLRTELPEKKGFVTTTETAVCSGFWPLLFFITRV